MGRFLQVVAVSCLVVLARFTDEHQPSALDHALSYVDASLRRCFRPSHAWERAHGLLVRGDLVWRSADRARPGRRHGGARHLRAPSRATAGGLGARRVGGMIVLGDGAIRPLAARRAEDRARALWTVASSAVAGLVLLSALRIRA